MEKLKFGRTGHLSTRLLFGATASYNTIDPEGNSVKRFASAAEPESLIKEIEPFLK